MHNPTTWLCIWNRIDLVIIEDSFIYQTPIEFLKPREPRLYTALQFDFVEHPRSPISAFLYMYIQVYMIRVRNTVRFWSILNSIWAQSFCFCYICINRGSRIKEAANDQWTIDRSLPSHRKADVAHSLNIDFRPWSDAAGSFSAWF